MTATPTTPAQTGDAVVDLNLSDLDALLESRHALRFSEEHIVEWLRASGGTLAERIMKSAAADLIERQQTLR